MATWGAYLSSYVKKNEAPVEAPPRPGITRRATEPMPENVEVEKVSNFPTCAIPLHVCRINF
jgi:hypothetical protein